MVSTHFQDSERRSPSGIGASAATGFTLCGWVNWHTTVYQVLFWLHNAAFDGWIEVTSTRTSDPVQDIIGFAVSGCEIEAEPNTWVFFAATISGDTASLRISTDGATLSDAVNGPIDTGWNIDSISVGGRDSWELFAHGEFHHARVWANTLTEAEILAELTSTAPAGSPWAAWELENTNINDYSGNDRHLTRTSGTLTVGSLSPPQPNNAATIGSGF